MKIAIITRLATWIQNAFYLDLRSLALFRIFLGLFTIFYAVQLLFLSSTFMAVDGIIPIKNVAKHYGRWHPFSYFDSLLWQQFLLVLIISLAIAYVAGYKSRLVSIILWILTLSLFWKLKIASSTAQRLMYLMYIWSIFLPVAEVWTYKDFKKKKWIITSTNTSNFRSFIAGCFVLQVMAIYFLSTFFKLQNASWIDGSAAYKAMYVDNFVSWLSVLIRAYFSPISVIATMGVLIIEILAPLLLIAPWNTERNRMIGLFLLLLLVSGFGTFLSLGLLPMGLIIFLIPIVPSVFWDWIQKKYKKKIIVKENDKPKQTLAFTVIGICMCLCIVYGNMYNLNPNRFKSNNFLDKTVYGPLQLAQKWNFYTQTTWVSTWITIKGTTKSGKKIDIWRWWTTDKRHTFDKEYIPKNISKEQYKNRSYYRNYIYFGLDRNSVYRQLQQYLCRQYNKKYYDDPLMKTSLYIKSKEVRGFNNFGDVTTKKVSTIECKKPANSQE